MFSTEFIPSEALTFTVTVCSAVVVFFAVSVAVPVVDSESSAYSLPPLIVQVYVIVGVPEYSAFAVKVVLPSQAIELFSALTVTEVTLFSTARIFTVVVASLVVPSEVAVTFTVTSCSAVSVFLPVSVAVPVVDSESFA